MRHWSFSVRGRLVLAIMVATLPALLYSLYSAQEARQREAKNALLAANRIALAAAAYPAQTIEGSRDLLLGLAESPLAEFLDNEDRCAESIRDVNDRFTQYTNLAIFNTHGVPICSASRMPVGVNVKDRTWFQRVLDEKTFAAGGYELSEVTQQPVLVTAVPILSHDNGPVSAVIAAEIPLGWLKAVAAQFDLPPSSNLVVLEQSGRPITGIPEEPGRAIEMLPPLGRLQEMLAKNAGAFRAVGQDGVERYFGEARLRYSDITLVIGLPDAFLLAGATKDFWARTAQTVGVWILTLIAAWVATDLLIARWIRRLSRATREVSRGNFALRPPVPKSESELRQLAEDFITMTDRVQQREESLKRAVDEKDILLREIHHRVQNNLQTITSLLNLQSTEDLPPEAVEKLTQAKTRIRALSLVHTQLYASADLSRVVLNDLIREICRQFWQIFDVDTHRVACEVAGDQVEAGVDAAVPLALLVTEAVTNALKYAFPDERSGTVRITFGRAGDRVALEIADDGVGFPPDAPARDRASRHSLGLRLIAALAKQVDGDLRIDGANGVKISVSMPVQRLDA
jgi:two-component sensor histidine kinase